MNRKSFWTVLEECIGQWIEGDKTVRVMLPSTIEDYFSTYPGWEGAPLGSWLDSVLDERQRPTNFRWKVEREGENLKFTPLGP